MSIQIRALTLLIFLCFLPLNLGVGFLFAQADADTRIINRSGKGGKGGSGTFLSPRYLFESRSSSQMPQALPTLMT